jgi:hypothetical protein
VMTGKFVANGADRLICCGDRNRLLQSVLTGLYVVMKGTTLEIGSCKRY